MVMKPGQTSPGTFASNRISWAGRDRVGEKSCFLER